MKLRAAVFDFGETLLSEERAWGVWADWIGVTPQELFAALGATVEGRYPHRHALELCRPGLDLSRASLELARRCGAYDSLAPADLQQPLGLENGGVDAVVCVGVMTYLPDVEAVWRELARVVRPGGLVVVTQREDLWHTRACRAVVDRLQSEGVWTPLEIAGPAPYLPKGYGGTPEVGCYYLTALVG